MEAATATPSRHRMFPAFRPERRNAGSAPTAPSTLRNVFNANFIYELPFGAGKPYLSQNGFTKAIFSYWQISSIFIARSGFPVNLTTSGTGPDGNTNDQRPNLVPGQPLYLAGGDINPNAFCTPGHSRPVLSRGHVPRRGSAMSLATSCEVPGSGNPIGQFPDAFLSQNGHHSSSGPRYSTFSTERSMPTRMASFRLPTSAEYICL